MNIYYFIYLYKKFKQQQKIKHYGNFSNNSFYSINDFSIFWIRKTYKIYQVMRSETLNEILSVLLILTLILVTAYIETI